MKMMKATLGYNKSVRVSQRKLKDESLLSFPRRKSVKPINIVNFGSRL